MISFLVCKRSVCVTTGSKTTQIRWWNRRRRRNNQNGTGSYWTKSHESQTLSMKVIKRYLNFFQKIYNSVIFHGLVQQSTTGDHFLLEGFGNWGHSTTGKWVNTTEGLVDVTKRTTDSHSSLLLLYPGTCTTSIEEEWKKPLQVYIHMPIDGEGEPLYY